VYALIDTCRHLACEEDREQEVRLLVSAGADATLANEVLHLAVIIVQRLTRLIMVALWNRADHYIFML